MSKKQQHNYAECGIFCTRNFLQLAYSWKFKCFYSLSNFSNVCSMKIELLFRSKTVTQISCSIFLFSIKLFFSNLIKANMLVLFCILLQILKSNSFKGLWILKSKSFKGLWARDVLLKIDDTLVVQLFRIYSDNQTSKMGTRLWKSPATS